MNAELADHFFQVTKLSRALVTTEDAAVVKNVWCA